MNKKQNEEYVNPLELVFDDEEVVEKPSEKPADRHSRGRNRRRPHNDSRPSPEAVIPNSPSGKRGLAYFVTGTDTGVGKTTATFVLATLLKERGADVGIMKPVQCGGEDTKFLMGALEIKDPAEEVNPYFAPEPLSPHLAFSRQKQKVEPQKILNVFQSLRARHDVLLIEGAGGLLVPLTDDYLVADLVRDMDVEVIVVARLGLGTINHSLLTVQKAREMGLSVRGILFCDSDGKQSGLPEQTNPRTIGRIGRVPIIGVIPHLTEMTRPAVVQTCSRRVQAQALLQPRRGMGEQLGEWDRRYIWHPFTQMQDWLNDEPLVIDSAKGCTLRDTKGRSYLDGISSLWVNVHGHRHPVIDRAIKEQISRLSHSTLLGLSNTPAILLARKLVQIAPRGLQKVFYSDNGSTAVEVAVKMAYQYWQNTGKKDKTEFVHLSHSYHGDTLGSVSLGGIDLFHKVYEKLTVKTITAEFPDFYRAPEGKSYPQYTEECLANLEKVFESKGPQIAALIVEPLVQGAAGMIVWPEGIFKRLAELCQKYEVLLIADEVATGFGRTGRMFACEHERVTPDFLCLAKGLTGGYLPLAATLTTQRIFDGFCFPYQEQKAFFHGHTYTGNPLACAAALASLDVFEKERVLHRLQPKIKHLSGKLRMFYNLPCVGDVRQKGMMAGVELVRNKETREPFAWEDQIGVKVCRKARERGVILRPLGNVIVLMPPLAISEKEIDELVDAAQWAIKEVTQG